MSFLGFNGPCSSWESETSFFHCSLDSQKFMEMRGIPHPLEAEGGNCILTFHLHRVSLWFVVFASSMNLPNLHWSTCGWWMRRGESRWWKMCCSMRTATRPRISGISFAEGQMDYGGAFIWGGHSNPSASRPSCLICVQRTLIANCCLRCQRQRFKFRYKLLHWTLSANQ